MIKIIPAIDIIDGKCVRLTKGDYSNKTIYNDDPIEVAKQFENAGLDRLHLVDLDGAKAGTVINWKVLENIAAQTSLKIDFSGGLSSTQNVVTAFNSGANLLSIGSVAVKNKSLFKSWIDRFGVERFLLGADVSNEMIMVKGWTEQTLINVYDFISEYRSYGIQSFFCTDIELDGMLKGPSIQLYKSILSQCPEINLIASGGVRSAQDIEELKQIGCKGVIVGKAIYEGSITYKELGKYAY